MSENLIYTADDEADWTEQLRTEWATGTRLPVYDDKTGEPLAMLEPVPETEGEWRMVPFDATPADEAAGGGGGR